MRSNRSAVCKRSINLNSFKACSVADIPDIKPLPSAAAGSVADDSETVAGVPAWLNAMTLAVGIAALVVIGLCTWSLFCQAVGPDAGPNGLASFYSETDRSR